MEKEILELFLNYSLNNKVVDMEYLNKLASIVVEGKNLSNYFNGLMIESQNDKEAVALYRRSDKKIRLYSTFLKEELINLKKYKILFNELGDSSFINYMITEILIHELMHVSQNKIKEELGEDGKINIKDIIVALSFGTKIASDNDLLYLKAPHERMADIDTLLLIKEMLLKVERPIPNLTDYVDGRFYLNLLRGYYEESAPTIDYLNGLDDDRLNLLLHFLQKMDNLSNEEKIYCGLPVPNKELEKLDKLYNETKYSKIRKEI